MQLIETPSSQNDRKLFVRAAYIVHGLTKSTKQTGSIRSMTQPIVYACATEKVNNCFRTRSLLNCRRFSIALSMSVAHQNVMLSQWRWRHRAIMTTTKAKRSPNEVSFFPFIDGPTFAFTWTGRIKNRGETKQYKRRRKLNENVIISLFIIANFFLSSFCRSSVFAFCSARLSSFAVHTINLM